MKDTVQLGLSCFPHIWLRASGVRYAISKAVRILLFHRFFSRRAWRDPSLLLWLEDKLCVTFIFWLVDGVDGLHFFAHRQPVRTKLFLVVPSSWTEEVGETVLEEGGHLASNLHSPRAAGVVVGQCALICSSRGSLIMEKYGRKVWGMSPGFRKDVWYVLDVGCSRCGVTGSISVRASYNIVRGPECLKLYMIKQSVQDGERNRVQDHSDIFVPDAFTQCVTVRLSVYYK